jgi:hypothetical protein
MASLGSWPSAFVPDSFKLVMQTSQRVNASPFGGSEQVLDLLCDRWICSLSLPMRDQASAAAVEAFLASFRGQINTVNLWHWVRPVPRGTLRGTLLTSGTQAQGASQLVLSGGTAGGTLLQGDLVGAGGQLLMVSTDCTADGSGNITVPLVNRLRAAILTAQSVTWNKPTLPFRVLSHAGIEYTPGIASQVDLSLGEVI